MAENYVLEAEARSVVGKKVSQLRRDGLVPVVVYGPKVEPMNLQVPYRPLQVALMKVGGTSLIDIKVGKKTHTVIARSVQRDILRGDILHVDFFAVDETAVIRADVPIHFINESPAVVAKRGILITGPAMLHVETLPSALISAVEIDLSTLDDVGKAIYVRDLSLDEGVVILNDPDEMLARVSQTSAARALEAEAAEAEEASQSEPEIIHKGKAEEEDF